MKTFSRVRFTQIRRYVHFEDNTTLIPKGQDGHDKLGKIRPFMELVNGQFQKLYAPTRNLYVDETLVKFKGRLSRRQFIKDKPTRFGLKASTLADSENGYVLDLWSTLEKNVLQTQRAGHTCRIKVHGALLWTCIQCLYG